MASILLILLMGLWVEILRKRRRTAPTIGYRSVRGHLPGDDVGVVFGQPMALCLVYAMCCILRLDRLLALRL